MYGCAWQMTFPYGNALMLGFASLPQSTCTDDADNGGYALDTFDGARLHAGGKMSDFCGFGYERSYRVR